MYAFSKGTNMGDLINTYSKLYFEKNLYSGRQEIWFSIIESMTGHVKIFGHGTGSGLGDIVGADLSAHNSFFQIFFQTGLFGLILVIIFLYKSVPINLSLKQDKIKVAFLSAIILPASAEVFIFQNHPVISMLLMIVLALDARKVNA